MDKSFFIIAIHRLEPIVLVDKNEINRVLAVDKLQTYPQHNLSTVSSVFY